LRHVNGCGFDLRLAFFKSARPNMPRWNRSRSKVAIYPRAWAVPLFGPGSTPQLRSAFRKIAAQ
jgi:hypothetical protein